MSPDRVVTFQFSGRQRQIHASLVEKGQRLADLYEGALRAFSELGNPVRIIIAAHSMRELVGKLPEAFDLPIPVDPGKITEQANALEPAWESALASGCRQNGEWTGTIDGPLASLLRRLDEFFEWLKENRPKHRELVTQMFREVDPSPVPLPPSVEEIRVNRWLALRRYFNNSAHGKTTTQQEFLANVDALEGVLAYFLNPQPSEDLSAIDKILREATDA